MPRPNDHLPCRLRALVDTALGNRCGLLDAWHSHTDPLPPEQLLRALLLKILFALCCEWLLMEQLDYNLLFHCFVGLGIDEAVRSCFT